MTSSESSRTAVRQLLARAMLLLAVASVLSCAQLVEHVCALISSAQQLPETGGAILSALASDPDESHECRS